MGCCAVSVTPAVWEWKRIMSERGLDGINPRMLRHVLLQDVVLNGPAQLRRIDTLLLRRRDVEAIENYRGPVDGHRRRDPVQRYAVEQCLHVGEAGDRDAAFAYFSLGPGMIGVVTHQRREIERH